MLDLFRYHDILLGGLWVFLSAGLRALALPDCCESKALPHEPQIGGLLLTF